jgi:2-haloacid dehalogenase
MDSGKPFQEAIIELQAEYPQYQEQIAIYDSRWVEMVSGELADSVELLGELRAAGYHLAALSNWSLETFPRIKHQYPFLDWFEPLVLSGEQGVSKPDPAVYQILLEKLNKQAEDCLFIDDLERNLIAAEKIGFDVIQFFSVDGLRAEFNKRGLL